MKSVEITAVVQMGLGGEFGEFQVKPEIITFLSSLKPPVRYFQPVVVIASPDIQTTSQLREIPQPEIPKVLYAESMGSLTENLKGLKTFPRGIVLLASPENPVVKTVVDQVLNKGKERHHKRLWVVEIGASRPQETNFETKKNSLRRFGLVEVKVYYDAQNNLVISTGRPEKKTKRKPVDLTRLYWIEPVQKKIAGELLTRGWLIVSSEEIDEILLASGFPPGDIRRLKMGFGLLVRGPCGGCLYKIDKNGIVTQVLDCADEDNCQAIIEKLKPKETPKCSCGQFCVWHKNPGKYICPSCGEAEST